VPPPTVTGVTPSTGLSGGGSIVTVSGTNFDAAVGANPAPNVTVMFGTLFASDVRVLSATDLTCIPPRGIIGIDADTTDVTVTVENVDAGPNQGTGSLSNAFTYNRPDLTVQQHLTKVQRTFIALLQNQVLANVAPMTHSDWADADAAILKRPALARLPAIQLLGPVLSPQRVCNYNEATLELLPTGDPAPTDFRRYDQVRSVDLEFDLRVLSTRKSELSNLIQHLVGFTQRNEFIYVDKDPLLPSAGTVRYPLLIVQDFRVEDRPSRSNVREAVASWRIEGVILENGDVVEESKTVDTSVVTTEQIP
jgi:hypothetical protein